MATLKARQYFPKEMGLIKHKGIRKIVAIVLERVPAGFYTKPASSTGKYHPKSSLGHEGLIRHVRLVALYARFICEVKMFSLSEIQEDLLIAAALLHDSVKYGLEDGPHTAKDHAQIAATFLEDSIILYDEHIAHEMESPEQYEYIKKALRGLLLSHHGQWSNPLPEPSIMLERLFHLADYLASRKEFDSDEPATA